MAILRNLYLLLWWPSLKVAGLLDTTLKRGPTKDPSSQEFIINTCIQVKHPFKDSLHMYITEKHDITPPLNF